MDSALANMVQMEMGNQIMSITQGMTKELWVSLISEEHTPANEEVVLIRRLKRPYNLRLPKGNLKKCFDNYAGTELTIGSQVLVSPVPVDQRELNLAGRITKLLALTPGCHVCITRQKANGLFLLKRLDIQNLGSDVPGSVVIDSFSEQSVTRKQYSSTDFGAIDLDDLRELVSRMGPFRYDAITAMKKVGGRIGYLFRREFGQENEAQDRELVSQWCNEILAGQSSDGGWGESLVTTAFNLIRLMELGRTKDDPHITKAAEWLISQNEPVGLPGMFMATVSLFEELNSVKEKGDGKRMVYDKVGRRKKYQPVVDAFRLNTDMVPGVCELALTSASAVVLQALLRLGLADHQRVRKAINTVLAMWSGRWCGCGAFGRDTVFPASDDPPDFNTRFVLSNWVLDDSAAAWFGDAKRLKMNALRSQCWQIGENEVLVEQQVNAGDYCTFGVHEALSYHPAYSGSNLETMAALEYARRQTSLGRWGPSRSMMLHNLARLSHPLAAFLVARTIPQLIRDQEEDGLWPGKRDHGDKTAIPESGIYENNPREVTGFRVLMVLKRFGFLKLLIPK
jgi:hypothetical protein